MVAVYDQLTEELQRCHLRLNDELVFSPQKYGQEVFVHIEVPSASRFFRIGYAEYVFISQFNGNTTSATALAITAQSQGPQAINENKAREVIDWLLENGLAVFVESDSGVKANDKSKTGAWLSKLNPFWIKLPLGNPDKFMKAMLPWCQCAFHPLAILVSLLVMLYGLATALTNWTELFGGFSVFASGTWAWLLLSWVALKLIHEFAHGMVCRYFGGQVRETGLIFILLAPMAYVDVTSSWRFSSKWKRIAVASAGMYVELFIASICVLALLYTESPILRNVLTSTIVMSGITTLLFNANPLMRFDGYFILSDLLAIPNLYENGSKAFRQDAGWIFLGQTSESVCHEIKTRRYLTSLYGWLASLWKVMICVGMTITASTMFGGFGILLAIFGCISWFGKPILETSRRLSIQFKKRPQSAIRTASLTGLVVMFFVASWFWIPSPFYARVPCLIEFEDAAKVRAESSGFVAEIFVKEGSLVKANQPLLRIENHELASQVKELRAELRYEQTRERIAIDQNRVAEAQVALRQQESIETTLDSRQRELDGLVIRAPNDGRVVARNLATMMGSYLTKGDIVLHVGNDKIKEVILSLPAVEVNAAKGLIGGSIPIEVGSRRRFYAKVKRLAPRATTQVSHLSLIDPNGGSIPVRATGSSNNQQEKSPEYEYCEPRLTVVAELEKSIAQAVWAGERGQALLSSSNPTLGKWMFVSTRDWLRKQIRLASPPENNQ